MTVHVWDNEENIVPPAEISSRLNLRESEDFLVKYKIAGILTETTIEGEDLTIFYIIIGVLALLLVVAICVSVIIVCMIKRKFDRKQRAAEVLNEVNAGKIYQKPYCMAHTVTHEINFRRVFEYSTNSATTNESSERAWNSPEVYRKFPRRK